MLDEHKVEQEPSTHAGETKYEGRRRDGGRRGRGGYELEEKENRGKGCGRVAQTLGCPQMNKGWYKQRGQGVGTQIVGGPKIRVGWVERSFYGGVERSIGKGTSRV